MNGKKTTITYDTLSQLPILFMAPGIKSYVTYEQWHHSQALHAAQSDEGFKNLIQWIHQGHFPGIDRSLADIPDPACTFCNFGKAHCKCHKAHNGHISDGHTTPGQGFSSDGLESATPGRPFTTKGSPSKLRYDFVSFWVDHMSTFVYVTFHASKAATELVKSKTEFEQFVAKYNVRIQSIRADNGVYSTQLFRDSCTKHQQTLTFCAVGAHWQNGIAERFIGTITQHARTILLQAMAKWPDVTSIIHPYGKKNRKHPTSYSLTRNHHGV